MATIFWFDTETTDVKTNRGGGIHELSYIIEENGVNVVERELKIAPCKNDLINADSLSFCGKTYEDIKKYPPASSAFRTLVSDIKDRERMIMGGYNIASFDIPFFLSWWWKAKSEARMDSDMMNYFYFDALDVRTIALDYLIDERSKMQDFKLASVARKLGLTTDESSLHTAIYDVQITQKIYHTIKNKI